MAIMHQVDEGGWNLIKAYASRRRPITRDEICKATADGHKLLTQTKHPIECGGDDETFKGLPWFLADHKCRTQFFFTPSFTYVFAAMGRLIFGQIS
jgi:hypothetical protein